jgi:hypothetical protein
MYMKSMMGCCKGWILNQGKSNQWICWFDTWPANFLREGKPKAPSLLPEKFTDNDQDAFQAG